MLERSETQRVTDIDYKPYYFNIVKGKANTEHRYVQCSIMHHGIYHLLIESLIYEPFMDSKISYNVELLIQHPW